MKSPVVGRRGLKILHGISLFLLCYMIVTAMFCNGDPESPYVQRIHDLRESYLLSKPLVKEMENYNYDNPVVFFLKLYLTCLYDNTLDLILLICLLFSVTAGGPLTCGLLNCIGVQTYTAYVRQLTFDFLSCLLILFVKDAWFGGWLIDCAQDHWRSEYPL